MAETRTEYRLVVEQVGGVIELRPESLAHCEARAKAIRGGSEVFDVRIQTRTVTEAPWVDLQETEAPESEDLYRELPNNGNGPETEAEVPEQEGGGASLGSDCDLVRIVSDPESAFNALPAEERAMYEAAQQSIVDARRAAYADEGNIVLGATQPQPDQQPSTQEENRD